MIYRSAQASDAPQISDESPTIKIFVSHRIDVDSAVIENPIYIHMRCGADYDKRENQLIQGDNIADHISYLQPHFSEFTIQYWAWKNCEADYYGLCHYRRYLSFAKRRYPTQNYRFVMEPILCKRMEKKHGLIDPVQMRKDIRRYDGIIPEKIPLAKVETPHGIQKTVYDLWALRNGEYFEKNVLDQVVALVDRMAPEYSKAARAYFADDAYWGFNCFILRKELFDRLCRFQFPIMFELENKLALAQCTGNRLRTPAYVGEMLYGIFLFHLENYERWNLNHQQLILIENVGKYKGWAAPLLFYFFHYSESLAKRLLKPLFPIGSAKRERIKRIYFRVNRRKNG